MTTYRVAELTGALLDAAVAKAEGLEFEYAPECGLLVPARDRDGVRWRPSLQWMDGGPLLEREQIGIDKCYDEWCAAIPAEGDKNADGAFHEWGTPAVSTTGPTPLIAAMRAYAALKLGETIDL